jgi:anaerobic ribonucleoside-triphosphate reductase activating protein
MSQNALNRDGEPLSTFLGISRVHFPVTTLGPGARIGIWVQGCSIQCPGCISLDTWKASEATTTVRAVIEAIEPFLAEASGVTITGGEPFDQVDALGELLTQLRGRMTAQQDILVYSGYAFLTIERQVNDWFGLIDALISEPFLIEAPQTRPLMGSDNQRLHLLTPLGQLHFQEYERSRNAEDDQFDLMLDPSGTAWLAGIPKRGDFDRLQLLLHAQGTTIQTSAHRILPR